MFPLVVVVVADAVDVVIIVVGPVIVVAAVAGVDCATDAVMEGEKCPQRKEKKLMLCDKQNNTANQV